MVAVPGGRGNRAAELKSNNHAALKGSLPWVEDPDPNGSTLTLYLNGAKEPTDAIDIASVPPDTDQFSLADANQHWPGRALPGRDGNGAGLAGGTHRRADPG